MGSMSQVLAVGSKATWKLGVGGGEQGLHKQWALGRAPILVSTDMYRKLKHDCKVVCESKLGGKFYLQTGPFHIIS